MANFRKAIFHGHSRAQAFVEFAIIVPIFLIVLTGIIEFGYAVFTWAAVDEVARIGIRYAVTGQFDPQYCDEADAALGLTADEISGGDAVDCKVPATVTDYETKTEALQDWARLMSIRDSAAKGGSSGLLIYPQNSGNYLQYIQNPSATFSQSYRGLPYANGYFSISMCSNRPGAAIDPNPYYYNGSATYANQFLGICKVDGKYMDDAGGPGNRVRITVTYDHPLIIPFFNAIWPNLKISTSQDAIVEKFRTSRVTGLTSGIAILPTWSPTPLPTGTATITSTATATATSTATPQKCTDKTGSGIRGKYYGNLGTANDAQRFTNLVLERIDSTPFFDWGTGTPDPSLGADNFEVRWEGKIYPPYPGPYTFTFTADDGIRAWMIKSGTGTPLPIISTGWKDQGATPYTYTTNLDCADYDIVIEYYENGGGAVMKLNWSNAMIGTSTNGIPSKYLFPLPLEAVPTRTNTPTATATPIACTHPNGNGLRGDYYGNLGTVGDSQRFTNLVFTRTDTTVFFDWGTGSPDNRLLADYFQVRWTGQIFPDYPGDYTFQFTSDDGFRVYLWKQGDPVPTTPVSQYWNGQSPTLYTYPLTLTCAYYNIKVEYFEDSGGAVFKLGWQADALGIASQAIPQKNLFTPTTQIQPTSTYVTNTPTRTNTPTYTPIPPTATNTPTPTNTPIYQPPTNTPTPLPPTHTPPPTSTSTKCPTSTDLGGCG